MIASLNLLKEMPKNTRSVSSIVSRRSLTNMRSLKHLYSAADLLHRRFRTMLMVNSCSTLITMFSSSYYSIEFLRERDVVMLFRDGSDIVGSFIRFWLTCHTADRIQEAVSTFCVVLNTCSFNKLSWKQATECIPILRELRERRAGKADAMSYTDRIKVYKFNNVL